MKVIDVLQHLRKTNCASMGEILGRSPLCGAKLTKLVSLKPQGKVNSNEKENNYHPGKYSASRSIDDGCERCKCSCVVRQHQLHRWVLLSNHSCQCGESQRHDLLNFQFGYQDLLRGLRISWSKRCFIWKLEQPEFRKHQFMGYSNLERSNQQFQVIQNPVKESGAPLWTRTLSVFLAVPLLLTACSSNADGVLKDSASKAILDPVNGEIIMPISDYLFASDATSVIELDKAYNLMISNCMEDSGFTFTGGTTNESIESFPGDRTYGLWDVNRAKKYAWGTAPSPSDSNISQAPVEEDSKLNSALKKCQEFVASKYGNKMGPSQEDQQNSIANRILTEAYNAAVADPTWSKMRKRWWKCLEENGLEAEKNGESWISKQGRAILESSMDSQISEDAIRVAVIEATCNVQSELTQTLANLEATYQTPLIEKNQAALNKEKERNNSFQKFARDYILGIER